MRSGIHPTMTADEIVDWMQQLASNTLFKTVTPNSTRFKLKYVPKKCKGGCGRYVWACECP